MSSNSTEEDVFGPRYHKTTRITIVAVMIAVSLLGNSVVCVRLLVSRRRRYSKATVLFLNLAVADLLVTLVTMTSQIVWEIMDREWIAGDAFCRFFKVLQTFALVSSTYMLVSIALDRHFAIVRPLSICPKPSRLALGAWLTSLIPSIPNLYVFREVLSKEGKCYCASLFYTGDYPLSHRQLYMAFVFTSVFIIPFLLLVCLYTRILLEIWRQAVAITGCQKSTSALPRAKIKTLKMTIVIFLAFILTNTPYVVQEMMLAFGDPHALDKNIVALFGVISASNSAINPYIYLTFHAKGILASCCKKAFTKVPRNQSYIFRSNTSNRTSVTSHSRISLSTRPITISQGELVRLGTWLSIKNGDCPYRQDMLNT